MPDELLSTAQAAELLGCDRTTIARRVHTGVLRVHARVPGTRGAFLFTRADVEATRPLRRRDAQHPSSQDPTGTDEPQHP